MTPVRQQPIGNASGSGRSIGWEDLYLTSTIMRYSEQSMMLTAAHERTSERSPHVSRLMPGFFRTLQLVSPVSPRPALDHAPYRKMIF
jgi:hypothetical protein